MRNFFLFCKPSVFALVNMRHVSLMLATIRVTAGTGYYPIIHKQSFIVD